MNEMNKIPFKWQFYSLIYRWYGSITMYRRTSGKKVFCIGLNKTGTTSWTQAMSDLGYRVGNERAAEIFFDDWVQKKYARILNFCKSAQAFQDVPFSLPGMYLQLHRRYPDSLFVLTVRDSAQQWYQSVTRFHAKMWSLRNHCPPTPQDLKKAVYIYEGWPAAFCHQVFQTPMNDPYNQELLLRFYNDYVASTSDYFEKYPQSFLKINVAKPGSLKTLCGFLGTPYSGGEFPWKNRNTG